MQCDLKFFQRSFLGTFLGWCLSCGLVQADTVANFDSLTFGSENYENGANLLPSTSADRSFTTGGATFNNYFTSDKYGSYWEGWAYSKVTDNADYGNVGGEDQNYLHQYGAITGGGVVKSQTGATKATGDIDTTSTYAVSLTMDYYITAPIISFATPQTVAGAYFTNTAYAYYTIKNGNAYANAFDANDWFCLTISGYNSAGNLVGSKDFYLAGNGSIVNTWQWVDLSDLGSVASLSFSQSSTDNGDWGMNTPAYFAMDNLTLSSTAVPEPGSITMVLSGLTALAWRWRRGKR